MYTIMIQFCPFLDKQLTFLINTFYLAALFTGNAFCLVEGIMPNFTTTLCVRRFATADHWIGLLQLRVQVVTKFRWNNFPTNWFVLVVLLFFLDLFRCSTAALFFAYQHKWHNIITLQHELNTTTFTPTVQLPNSLINRLLNTYSLLVHNKSTDKSHLHSTSLPYIPLD